MRADTLTFPCPTSVPFLFLSLVFYPSSPTFHPLRLRSNKVALLVFIQCRLWPTMSRMHVISWSAGAAAHENSDNTHPGLDSAEGLLYWHQRPLQHRGKRALKFRQKILLLSTVRRREGREHSLSKQSCAIALVYSHTTSNGLIACFRRELDRGSTDADAATEVGMAPTSPAAVPFDSGRKFLGVFTSRGVLSSADLCSLKLAARVSPGSTGLSSLTRTLRLPTARWRLLMTLGSARPEVGRSRGEDCQHCCQHRAVPQKPQHLAKLHVSSLAHQKRMRARMRGGAAIVCMFVCSEQGGGGYLIVASWRRVSIRAHSVEKGCARLSIPLVPSRCTRSSPVGREQNCAALQPRSGPTQPAPASTQQSFTSAAGDHIP